MADPRFYRVAGPYNIQELAVLADATVARGTGDDRKFTDVATLGEAGPQHVAFIDNRRYIPEFEKCAAGAILLAPDLVERAPAGAALLVTDRPYHGYARIARGFYPDVTSGLDESIPMADGVDDSARVDPTARLGAAVHVGPGAEIGARTVIGPNTVVGAGVMIGEDCLIGANVTLIYCLLGARVAVHGGVRIGQDGFGFAPGKEGHEKVPQLGRVVVGDDVEIGANTTIDRGAAPDTVIGAGTKIDNLVQIAHNVRIGENCLIAAQVGIAGSTTLGDFVMIGGQAGINGHLNIGDGVRIAAQTGVSKDVRPGATVVGFPADESARYWRRQAVLNRLAKGVLGDG